MHIIQPNWMAKVNLISDKSQVTIEFNLDEPGLRCRAESLHFNWIVTPGRLAVESDFRQFDCGEIVSGILKNLPWTPLTAIGSNVFFSGPIDEWENLPTSLRKFRPDGPKSYPLATFGHQVSVKRGDQDYNLSVFMREDEIRASANIHTTLKGKDDASDLARRAADNFHTHRRTVKRLFKQIFGIVVQQ